MTFPDVASKLVSVVFQDSVNSEIAIAAVLLQQGENFTSKRCLVQSKHVVNEQKGTLETSYQEA
jgi:hypothetical protein